MGDCYCGGDATTPGHDNHCSWYQAREKERLAKLTQEERAKEIGQRVDAIKSGAKWRIREMHKRGEVDWRGEG